MYNGILFVNSWGILAAINSMCQYMRIGKPYCTNMKNILIHLWNVQIIQVSIEQIAPSVQYIQTSS